MSHKKEKGGISFFVAGLAVAGAVAGYLLYGPNGAKNRKKVKEWSLEAREEVLAELEKLREVTREIYDETVDSVTEKYASFTDVGEEEAAKLNKELKKYWKHVKQEVEEDVAVAKKATKKAKKVAKKTTAKAKKEVKKATKTAKKTAKKATKQAKKVVKKAKKEVAGAKKKAKKVAEVIKEDTSA